MRPSVYPERIVYHESPAVLAAMKVQAERQGLTFAEMQRRVNRTGLRALGSA